MTPGFYLRLQAVEAYALGNPTLGDNLYRAAVAMDTAGASIIGGPLAGGIARVTGPIEERVIQTVVRDVASKTRRAVRRGFKFFG